MGILFKKEGKEFKYTQEDGEYLTSEQMRCVATFPFKWI